MTVEGDGEVSLTSQHIMKSKNELNLLRVSEQIKG